MAAMPLITLYGPTVTLRPLALDDAPALAAATGESREHYRFNLVPQGLEETQRYLEKALGERDAGRRMPFTILWHGRVVGSTSYWDLQPWQWPAGHPWQRADRPDTIEIGFTWLAASAQRTRCNTEAKLLLLRQAFDVWDVHRVAFRTDERNERSRRAIQRLGAVFEGIRRADQPGYDGSVRNTAWYSIVRAEWLAVCARLEGFLARG
jgi:RimJ/RimL family protein N-acetyltransferase